MIFQDSQGRPISLEQIVDLVDNKHDYEIYVGTDSQFHSTEIGVLYVTCIVLYKKGKGGKFFIKKEYVKINNSLREKLINETIKSLLVVFKLQEILPHNTEIVVHIDANSNKKHKSADYVQDLIGMVVGQGLKYKIKPHAWAAQSVANKYSK